MNTQTRSTFARFLGNRAAVVTAGTVGFLLGAGGFVAAQQGADDISPVTTQVVTTVDDTIVDATIVTTVDTTADTSVDTTDTSVTIVDVSVPDSIDDSSTSVPGDDDATSSSLPGNDDATSSSVRGSDDATSTSLPDDDDVTSTTIDDDDDDGDDATSTSVPTALPAPFSETYRSSGGSISVTWNGSTFSIDSITPAAGFVAEIEDNSWDKVRVDFENDDDDARIEVRLHEGSIRVRID